jgi:hypothetical protein
MTGRRRRKEHALVRYLYRVADDELFAYAPLRRDFFLVSDDRLWAHESHSWLLSAASSEAFARRIGVTYYDSESGQPLYYEAAAPDARESVAATVTRPRKRH